MTTLRALIIDDDEELRALLREYFSGHDIQLTEAGDGNEGLLALKAAQLGFDVVLLDVMLPITDGFALLPRIREVAETPVIMLTARGDDDDRIRGLELGADDYLAKPFNPKELVLRIRAIHRRRLPRSESEGGRAVLQVGELKLYGEAQEAHYRAQKLLLTSFEFRILFALAQQPGVPVSRESLAAVVGLGPDYDPSVDRSLDVHVSRLRQKLSAHSDGEARMGSILIKTARGTGYLLTRAL